MLTNPTVPTELGTALIEGISDMIDARNSVNAHQTIIAMVTYNDTLFTPNECDTIADLIDSYNLDLVMIVMRGSFKPSEFYCLYRNGIYTVYFQTHKNLVFCAHTYI